MTIVDRVKNILVTPKTEWPVIAGESTPTADLLKNYVAPLAAIPAVAGFISTSLIGYGSFGASYRVPIAAGLGGAIFSYVMSFVSVFVIAFIINALAPTFGTEKNDPQALKLTVYSFTASWVGGIFAIIPGLGILGILCALYGLYLLYLGLPRLMKCPEDKAVGFTVAILVAAVVVSLVIGAIVGIVIGGAAYRM